MKKRRSVCLLLSCLSFCFTMLVFSPGEFLPSHQRDFWFGWTDIGMGIAFVFTIGMLILYLWGRFLFRSSLIYSAVLAALSLLAYLQGNYINPDYGLLDGTIINWSSYTGYVFLIRYYGLGS